MQSSPEHLPRVSFVMPTLNVEALLDNVLSSITRQTYPRDRYEILLADAHSTDRTREIAKKYGAIVINDDGHSMEEGKRLALQHATGEYIVFVDADNEITHTDYIELAVKALAANPQALGVESYYLPSPKMSSFCAYLTHRLHISDPICWLMSVNPELVGRDGEVERWTLPGDSLSYPLGANGFVFRRADLESVKAGEHFQDTHAALHLMRAGKREWLRIRGHGVHHFYVQTLGGFVQKRRRATVHFLRVQEEAKINWMKEKPPVPLWLAGIYCVTFIGPLWHTACGLIRDRDVRWLWHVPASLGSVLGDAWGVWTYKRHGKDKTLIAELKVRQNLTKMKNSETPGVFNVLAHRTAQWLCQHRCAWPCRWLGRASYLVWRAYENRNFEMRTNGEEWCLRQIGGGKLQAKCAFDVGANVGEWLLLCRQYLPEATIHAFEIAPPVFDQLRQNVGGRPQIVLNPVGLSDRNGELDVFYTDSSNQLTSAYREHFSEAFELSGAKRSSPQPIRAKVIRGDDYAREHGIPMIDFLKIDVEGMEESVLRGFSNMFKERRIRLVQFEYNTTNIISKFMLRDAHQFFTNFGYCVGKLYPNHVEFRDYHYRQEDFCGPNMIAVRKEDDELLKLLGQRS